MNNENIIEKFTEKQEKIAKILPQRSTNFLQKAQREPEFFNNLITSLALNFVIFAKLFLHFAAQKKMNKELNVQECDAVKVE